MPRESCSSLRRARRPSCSRSACRCSCIAVTDPARRRLGQPGGRGRAGAQGRRARPARARARQQVPAAHAASTNAAGWKSALHLPDSARLTRSPLFYSIKTGLALVFFLCARRCARRSGCRRLPTSTLLFFAVLAARSSDSCCRTSCSTIWSSGGRSACATAFPDALDMLVVCVEAGLGLTAVDPARCRGTAFQPPRARRRARAGDRRDARGRRPRSRAQGPGGAHRARGHPRPGEPAGADAEVRHQHRRHAARVRGGVPRQAHAACRGDGSEDRHQADLPARVLPVPGVLRRRDRPGGDTLRRGVPDSSATGSDSERAA